MSTAAILHAFGQLEPSQQVTLVEELWDSIPQAATPPILTDAQKHELLRRKAALGGGPPEGRTMSEVRESLLAADGR